MIKKIYQFSEYRGGNSSRVTIIIYLRDSKTFHIQKLFSEHYRHFVTSNMYDLIIIFQD